MRSLFVTGTDTGVGKTLVTALLALALRARGIDAGVMKPLASGCAWHNGKLVSDDALFLREATGVNDSLDEINPIRLEEPLAPLVAARRAQIASHDYLKHILAAYEELRQRHDCVIVEGVGGIQVPIGEYDGKMVTCVDLINALGLPVVVVARRALGTINHTVLTCNVPLKQPAYFAGTIFCDALAIEEDAATETSPSIISEMTGLPIWGKVPFLENFSRENLMHAAKFIDVGHWDQQEPVPHL